ncbi:uncharacterized protein [Periplaneta americana]|uniref:uncharacterized protein n=1 Tax=Periplaneta americana TaxID=6978 RepID=UPI0037E7E440
MKTIVLLLAAICGAVFAEEKAAKTEKRGIFGLGYGHSLGDYGGGYSLGHGGGYSLGHGGGLSLGGHGIGLLSAGHGLGSSYGSYGGGFGYGTVSEGHVKAITITKEVPVPVPHPYPVTVEKKVPIPVPVKVPVPVDRPYPVHVPKPYPVTVEKPVPYPVEKPVPYPVKVPVKVPYPVSVPVHIPKPIAVPVPKPVAVPVPQPVIVHKAVPVLVKGHSFGIDGGYGGISGGYSLGHEGLSYGHSLGSYGHSLGSYGGYHQSRPRLHKRRSFGAGESSKSSPERPGAVRYMWTPLGACVRFRTASVRTFQNWSGRGPRLSSPARRVKSASAEAYKSRHLSARASDRPPTGPRRHAATLSRTIRSRRPLLPLTSQGRSTRCITLREQRPGMKHCSCNYRHQFPSLDRGGCGPLESGRDVALREVSTSGLPPIAILQSLLSFQSPSFKFRSYITLATPTLQVFLLAVLVASTLAGKEEEKKKKNVAETPKKEAAGKTEKRGVEEIAYLPQEHVAHHELAGGYAGGYGYGHGGYELGGQHSLGLLGYGHNLHPTSRIKSIVITKEVTIPVPHPYPVPVEKKIPYPVKVPVPVPVVRHYPVPVPKPYPVTIEKKVPYPVEKIVPYPVKVPVKVPYPVPHPVPVEKPYPVPVHVPQPVPVPHPVVVKKPVPVYFKEHDVHHEGLVGGFEDLGGHYGGHETLSYDHGDFGYSGGFGGDYHHVGYH